MEMSRSEATTLHRSSQNPVIATLWTVSISEDEGKRTIYSRVAYDEATLNLVKGMATEGNADINDYQPSLAIVVTWLRNTLVC